jgi:chitin disaccharide deacetylase
MKKNQIIIFILLVLLKITTQQTLAELLGYPAGSRLLILNSDDYGMCHAENLGTEKVIEYGLIKSATIMTVCPWAYNAISYAKRNNLHTMGVHVALTSEWSTYRWRPLNTTTFNSSLVDPNTGFMWRTTQEVEKNVKMDVIFNS